LRENHPCWPTNHQHKSLPQESVKNEDWVSPIPTIVKGVTNNNCKSEDTPNCNDEIGVISGKLTKTLISCNKNTATKKHKIIFMGDSYIRGYVSKLKPQLNNNFELYSTVKPGSSTKELNKTAKKEISQLSQDDLIAICSGTNDYETNFP
jgi:hypothetical protein